jgi:hypothetical protein
MGAYAEVVQLADFTGTKRKAHKAARAHLSRVASGGDVIQVLAAYALCVLADPKSSADAKGAELASILERAAELA